MKVHAVVQGSAEWKALRAQHDCASEAPIMMGHSPHVTRSDLVRMKAAGEEREIDIFTQKRFDDGHAAEALARGLIEAELGEDLYPVTCSDGEYLASYDGITMDDETGWECKLWNADLAEQVRRKDLGPAYWPQLEQQIRVKGLKRVLFTVSDGTRDNTITMEYRAVPGRWAQVAAAWKQFTEDVANYVHVEAAEKAVAQPVKALPALSIQIDGKIAVRDNLAIFGEQLKAFIERIPKAPATDQEFADADAAVKALKVAEERLDSAEESALAQVASVDDLRRQIAFFRDLARMTRLATDKLVEARKKAIRQEIINEGVQALAAHVLKLNERLDRNLMPHVASNFVEAVKGKKTVSGLRDGMETELARAKIAASETADGIEINLKALALHGKGFELLFADVATLCLKAPDDFLLVVKARLAEHAEKEAKRLETERERIRQEEAAKAEAAAQALVRTATAGEKERAAHVGSAPKPRLAVVEAPSSARARPTDDMIIEILSLHFTASEETVIGWLREIDLDAQEARLRRISQQA